MEGEQVKERKEMEEKKTEKQAEMKLGEKERAGFVPPHSWER